MNGRVLAAIAAMGAVVLALWWVLHEIYGAEIVDTGKRPALFLLVGIIASFLVIRANTRMIRAGVRWWPGNIEHGDFHVHHAVFGVLGMVCFGIGEFVFQPGSPWVEVVAFGFGAGTGLALDEFALFLHIEDVYWEEEGRKSIDAVILSIVVVAMFVVGVVPLGLNEEARTAAGPRWLAVAVVVANLALVVVTFLKGRLWLGVLGLAMPPFAWWGAARLGAPGSPWERRWYRSRPELRARARRRDDAFHEKWGRRKQRLWDLIAGPPRHRHRRAG